MQTNLREMAKSAMRIKEGQGTLFRPGAIDRIMQDLPETCDNRVLSNYMDTLDKRFQSEEMPQFGRPS